MPPKKDSKKVTKKKVTKKKVSKKKPAPKVKTITIKDGHLGTKGSESKSPSTRGVKTSDTTETFDENDLINYIIQNPSMWQ